jgi:hypothetical protein
MVEMRVRRAGLSPSATSIRVLTPTATSMIAGKMHAVAELYPMARIRSRSAGKLTEAIGQGDLDAIGNNAGVARSG